MCCLMRWKKRLIYSLHVNTLLFVLFLAYVCSDFCLRSSHIVNLQRSDVQEAQRSMLLSSFSVVPSRIFNWSFWVCLSKVQNLLCFVRQFIHLTEEFFHLEAWSTQSEAPVGTLLVRLGYRWERRKVLLKVQIEPSHLGINYEKE